MPWGANEQFAGAALAIGIAFGLDGLDGRIARMTNTVSDFGREIDSLADVITFGIAPSILAFVWGFQFIEWWPDPGFQRTTMRIAYFIGFMFLMCGAARLARFNVQVNPVPKNPGKPDRKYFVGLPIPAAAGMVASVVYAASGTPIRWWPLGIAWLLLLSMLSFLMVSTWRYRSFKDLNMFSPRSPIFVVLSRRHNLPGLHLLGASAAGGGQRLHIQRSVRADWRYRTSQNARDSIASSTCRKSRCLKNLLF